MNEIKKVNQLSGNPQRGAVSIMTIFMLLMMVTLGVFALTSARVNYGFSHKTLEWNTVYYALEDKAENYVKEVDNKLLEAWSEAAEYIAEKGYDKASYESFISTAFEDKLSDLMLVYLESSFVHRDDGLYAEMDFISDDNPSMHLQIVLKINVPAYNDIVNGNSEVFNRYTVCEWTEWQNPSGTKSGGMPIWDGIIR